MRLNSPGQFLASSGCFSCQDMTTKADQHPRARAMASWHAQTDKSSQKSPHPGVRAPPLSLAWALLQLQCLSSNCLKMLQSPAPKKGAAAYFKLWVWIH